MDDTDALRTEAAGLRGPARAAPLLRLSMRLEQTYWRAGPGQPASAPVLDELVEVLEEAYALLEPGSFLCGQAAGQLGTALATRHTVHFGPERDRERAVPLLEESLTFPALPHILQVRNKQQLAALLTTRAMRSLQDPGAAMKLLMPGPRAPEAADADRAVVLLSEVRDGPVLGSHITEFTELMLGMAEAVQSLLGTHGGPGTGPAGLDFGRLTQLMNTMADLQQKVAAQPRGAGFGYVPNAFDFGADGLAATDPLHRPVMVVDAPAAPPVDPAPAAAATQTPAATFRDAVTALLSSPEATLDLLADGAPQPDVDTVDELVALGSCLVEAPDAVEADHLTLAVARYLRGTSGGAGPEPDPEAADDLRAAGTHLEACAEALVAEPGDVVAVALRLADLLVERVPEVGDQLAVAFRSATDALRTCGADALVYPSTAGPALLMAATGRFMHGTAGDLPPRVMVVGDDAVEGAPVVSRVRTAAQLVTLVARERRPLTEAAVFVADPRGERPAAGGDALVLRRTFFPRSTGLGRTVDGVDGTGTPGEVAARLDASLLHLGCGVTADGDLELADGTVLPVATIVARPGAPSGGLAVLPPPAESGEGVAALTDALLASCCTGVVRFREPVDDRVAALVYFVLYTHLVDEGRDPADAVAAVRHWLTDPHRLAPEHLPAWYGEDPASTDLAGLGRRDVLVLHGR